MAIQKVVAYVKSLDFASNSCEVEFRPRQLNRGFVRFHQLGEPTPIVDQYGRNLKRQNPHWQYLYLENAWEKDLPVVLFELNSSYSYGSTMRAKKYRNFLIFGKTKEQAEREQAKAIREIEEMKNSSK